MQKLSKGDTISVIDLAQIQHGCAWVGCGATTKVPGGLPKDWRWLALWWGPLPSIRPLPPASGS